MIAFFLKLIYPSEERNEHQMNIHTSNFTIFVNHSKSLLKLWEAFKFFLKETSNRIRLMNLIR